MASDNDVEKAGDRDFTTATTSTAGSEKVEAGAVAEGAYGEPDSDHEEVEMMDAGHLDDLATQHVSPRSHQETVWLTRLDCGFYPSCLTKRRECSSTGNVQIKCKEQIISDSHQPHYQKQEQ